MSERIKLRKSQIGPIHELDILENGFSTTESINPTKYSKSFRVMMFSVPILVFLWYFTAVFAITSSKMILLRHRLPFLLCTIQFLFATIATYVIVRYHKQSNASPTVSIQTRQMFRTMIYPISLSYTFGFIFTNIAFSLAAPSFAETIKSGEPISSVALGYFYYNEGTTSLTYATLVPICLGVAISCVDGATFHLWGFINAAISNLCFSSRAVITKRLFSNYPGAMDEYQLFSHISRVGLIILVPTTLLLEGSKIRELVYDDIGSLSILIQLLLLNGVAYTSYNLLSFLVLSRTDLVTHAVFNVFRRVVIIVTTTWYFNTSLSILNIGGVSLAVFGVLLFVIAKRREMSSSMNEINGLSK